MRRALLGLALSSVIGGCTTDGPPASGPTCTGKCDGTSALPPVFDRAFYDHVLPGVRMNGLEAPLDLWLDPRTREAS